MREGTGAANSGGMCRQGLRRPLLSVPVAGGPCRWSGRADVTGADALRRISWSPVDRLAPTIGGWVTSTRSSRCRRSSRRSAAWLGRGVRKAVTEDRSRSSWEGGAAGIISLGGVLSGPERRPASPPLVRARPDEPLRLLQARHWAARAQPPSAGARGPSSPGSRRRRPSRRSSPRARPLPPSFGEGEGPRRRVRAPPGWVGIVPRLDPP